MLKFFPRSINVIYSINMYVLDQLLKFILIICKIQLKKTRLIK